MQMPAIDLNWLAVIAAALSAFVLGGLWYGPLFKNAWCREAGIDPALAPPHPARMFAVRLPAAWWRRWYSRCCWAPRRARPTASAWAS